MRTAGALPLGRPARLLRVPGGRKTDVELVAGWSRVRPRGCRFARRSEAIEVDAEHDHPEVVLEAVASQHGGDRSATGVGGCGPAEHRLFHEADREHVAFG